MIQLKQILEGLNLPNAKTQPVQQTDAAAKMTTEQKRKLSDMVSKFNEYGKAIYREADIMEISNHLQEISNLAESYALNECGDWFEEGTVRRNMLELKKYNESFSKIAKEAKVRQQQMEALYEDMGRVLERYFDIKDLDHVKHPADDRTATDIAASGQHPTVGDQRSGVV